ncbi:glycosyltransferase [Neobacillus muris]|uniref:glycosyltransferase n=1 Tax=Neobacillus muris TaxID=2941334 RepID=UPI00203C6DD0|nr:glycosyltransferase [Neobacillus muris]
MGGIEKALISMLEAIPKDQYEITVLLMGTGGELESEIPKHVKILPLYGCEKTVKERLWNAAKSGKFIQVMKICWYTALANMTKSKFKKEWYYAKRVPPIETEYDLAIAYHVPASLPVVFVNENIKAKTKIAWIHSDVFNYVKQLEPFKDFYDVYDKVFCVSKYAMKHFNELFPHLKEKTSVFYNIVDKNQMDLLSKRVEGFTDHYNGLRILTVGRLSPEKGQDIIPEVLQKLKSEGMHVRWYCLGDGDSRPKIEELITEYGLQDDLILLGTKNNPYNFIRQCDIYVQSSRHEGYCISLAEARAFNKPIVTTDFVGAREQIETGENGFIVKFDANEIYRAVKTLIYHQDLRLKFESNLKRSNVTTTNEIKKLFDCVG